MDTAEYLKLTAAALAADGNTIANVLLPGGPSVVGYQKQFRLRWMATMLHVFTVVVSVPLATPEFLHDVNVEAIAYAKRTKGSLRGLQTGVAVLPDVFGEPRNPPRGGEGLPGARCGVHDEALRRLRGDDGLLSVVPLLRPDTDGVDAHPLVQNSVSSL